MLITYTREGLLPEDFKLISTRILCLITLNLCTRVIFSYRQAEKDLSKLSATVTVCQRRIESCLVNQPIDIKYQRFIEDMKKISHTYLKLVLQIVINSGNAWLVSRTVNKDDRELKEVLGSNGQMNNFHDSFKEQCTM